MINWTWIPGKCVDGFRFGDPSEQVIRAHGLQKLEPDVPEAYWDTYEIPGFESRVMVEEDTISGILCCDQLTFKGTNLIGITPSCLRLRLGTEDFLEENVGLGCATHYGSLGATFWIVDGVVDSVTCWATLDSGGATGEQDMQCTE